MKKKEKGFLPVIYLSFLLLFPSLCRADQISLRVLVPKTEIHLQPDSKSVVIISVPAGMILESTKQIKEWFELKLPPNKDGFVIIGYVHSSKVEIWTEKQVKEKPVKRKPVTPPPPPSVKVERTVPPIKPVSKEPKLSNGSKIGFEIKLHSGAGYLKGGDINAHIQSMNDYWSDLNYINVSGGEFKPFHLGMEFGGEIVIMFSPKIGIGVGVGYLQASKESTVESTLSNTDFTDTFNPKISIIPLSLNLHFGLPLGEKLKLKIFSGMGYYLGTVNWNYNYDSSIGDEHYEEVWQGKSNISKF